MYLDRSCQKKELNKPLPTYSVAYLQKMLDFQKSTIIVAYLGTIQVLRHYVFGFFRPTQPLTSA